MFLFYDAKIGENIKKNGNKGTITNNFLGRMLVMEQALFEYPKLRLLNNYPTQPSKP